MARRAGRREALRLLRPHRAPGLVDGHAYRCSMALDFQIATRYQFSGEVSGNEVRIYRELLRGAVAQRLRQRQAPPRRLRGQVSTDENPAASGAWAARSSAARGPTSRRNGSNDASRSRLGSRVRTALRASARRSQRLAAHARPLARASAPLRQACPHPLAPREAAARRLPPPASPARRCAASMPAPRRASPASGQRERELALGFELGVDDGLEGVERAGRRRASCR